MCYFFLFFKKFLMFTLFEKERESVSMCKQGRARERGGQRIPSRLCIDSRELDMELELTNHKITTQAEIKVRRLTDSATREPLLFCDSKLQDFMEPGWLSWLSIQLRLRS